MISIIICSRTQNISENLSENIKNTVGCDYELIVIDNSQNQYSIFEAYNLGIDKSKGEYLCMIHDDIIIHTIGWGNSINSIFEENDQVGLIGIAGSQIKTKMPSGWCNCPDEFKKINIIQHLENKEIEKWDYGFKNGVLFEVVAIDGVFMAMRKVKNILFNIKIKGFHNYDLNISFEYKIRGYKVLATNSILIEHLSNGTMNQSWYETTLQLHEIYSNHLPMNTTEIINSKQLDLLEFENGTWFLNQLLSFGYIKPTLKLWMKLLLIKPNSEFHIKFLKRIILKIRKKNIIVRMEKSNNI
jgi:glycosyltransferase involved in cell wall biosynthesis